jgi:hypothetical protein
VALLCRAALLCDDDVRLQTAAPHLLALITQSAAKRGKGAAGAAEKLPAGVRALALRCLVRLVASVQVIPPSDAKVRSAALLPLCTALRCAAWKPASLRQPGPQGGRPLAVVRCCEPGWPSGGLQAWVLGAL